MVMVSLTAAETLRQKGQDQMVAWNEGTSAVRSMHSLLETLAFPHLLPLSLSPALSPPSPWHYFFLLKPGMLCKSVILIPGRQRQGSLCKFKTTLGQASRLYSDTLSQKIKLKISTLLRSGCLRLCFQECRNYLIWVSGHYLKSREYLCLFPRQAWISNSVMTNLVVSLFGLRGAYISKIHLWVCHWGISRGRWYSNWSGEPTLNVGSTTPQSQGKDEIRVEEGRSQPASPNFNLPEPFIDYHVPQGIKHHWDYLQRLSQKSEF